jgi:hypothetical protein
MARPMTAAQTLAALRKWKVKFQEYPGWDTRGRPGGLTDVHGVVEHHTGGGSGSASYLKFLFVTGRPEDGIPGPLCNTATAPDGTLHLGAIGRANHAGAGSQSTMDHVIAEDYSGLSVEIKPGPDGVNGNPHYYGNEVIYLGTEPMTDAAYETAVRHAAAICDFYGWSALSVIGHREHTRRKDDPGKTPMNKFRTDLAAVLRIGPNVTFDGKTPKAPTTGSTATPPKDTTMTLTNADAELVVDRLLPRDVGGASLPDCLSRARWLAQQFQEGGQFNLQLDRIEADVDS